MTLAKHDCQAWNHWANWSPSALRRSWSSWQNQNLCISAFENHEWSSRSARRRTVRTIARGCSLRFPVPDCRQIYTNRPRLDLRQRTDQRESVGLWHTCRRRERTSRGCSSGGCGGRQIRSCCSRSKEISRRQWRISRSIDERWEILHARTDVSLRHWTSVDTHRYLDRSCVSLCKTRQIISTKEKLCEQEEQQTQNSVDGAAYLYLFSDCRIGGIVVRTGCCEVEIPGRYDGANGRPIIDLAALGVLANFTLTGSVKPRNQRRSAILLNRNLPFGIVPFNLLIAISASDRWSKRMNPTLFDAPGEKTSGVTTMISATNCQERFLSATISLVVQRKANDSDDKQTDLPALGLQRIFDEIIQPNSANKVSSSCWVIDRGRFEI